MILDLPYPLAIALIAATLNLIPSIEATITGIIISLIALFGQFHQGPDRLRDHDAWSTTDPELRFLADDHQEGGQVPSFTMLSSVLPSACFQVIGGASPFRSRPRSRFWSSAHRRQKSLDRGRGYHEQALVSGVAGRRGFLESSGS